MRRFVYRLPFDVGFAPNPFWGSLTLGTCKPLIRKAARPGDTVFAILPMHGEDRLVYAARVAEVMGWREYWHDPRFEAKIPRVYPGATRAERVGDRCYRPRPDGSYEQLVSEHWSGLRWAERADEKAKDLSGPVLICREFSYFGARAPLLPPSCSFVSSLSRAPRGDWPPAAAAELDKLFAALPRGVHGPPVCWPRAGAALDMSWVEAAGPNLSTLARSALRLSPKKNPPSADWHPGGWVPTR